MKAAIKLYGKFKKYPERTGHQSLVKDAKTFAIKEFGLTLRLDFPEPVCQDTQGQAFSGKQVKKKLKDALKIQYWGVVESEKRRASSSRQDKMTETWTGRGVLHG